MREELLTRNVARLVQFDRYKPKKIVPWSLEEARRFLHVAQTHLLYPAFLIPLLYAMRRGEILGLRWRDIDFESNTIQVRQQLQRVGSELLTGQVKTDAGERNLPLFPDLRDALLKYEVHRQVRSGTSELAFTTTEGTPIEPRNFVRTFHQLCKKAGVRTIRFHDQRHTASTLLADLGVAPKVAQAILGHAHVSTTMQIYTHGRDEAQKDAISKLGAALLSEHTNDHDREDRGRSRQIWPSATDFAAWAIRIISGGSSGARTHDTLLKSSIDAPLSLRLAEVDWVMKRAKGSRKLGCVAVNLAVNQANTRPEVHAA
jgi:site-specific recombinase XerD